MSPQDSTSRPSPRRRLLLFLSGAILVALAVFLLFFGDRWSGDEETSPVVEFEQIPDFATAPATILGRPGDRLIEVGDIAPNFLLADLGGDEYELYNLRGKPVVINFWATWCVPCRVEMPALQAAYEKYRSAGLIILAVDYDEAPQTVRSFFYDELGLTFTPLLDEEGLVTQMFGVFNFPSTFFIDPEGRVAAIHRGPLHVEQIEENLAKILPVEN